LHICSYNSLLRPPPSPVQIRARFWSLLICSYNSLLQPPPSPVQIRVYIMQRKVLFWCLLCSYNSLLQPPPFCCSDGGLHHAAQGPGACERFLDAAACSKCCQCNDRAFHSQRLQRPLPGGYARVDVRLCMSLQLLPVMGAVSAMIGPFIHSAYREAPARYGKVLSSNKCGFTVACSIITITSVGLARTVCKHRIFGV
jgi:hypothetical protein